MSNRQINIFDIYKRLETLAREELHPDVEFSWSADWEHMMEVGNWLTRPDELDAVELVMRIEQEFDIQISDEEAAGLHPIEQTVGFIAANLTESHQGPI